MAKIGVLLLLPLLMASSCKKPESFEYRDIRNFKIDSLGFAKSTVTMELVYFNPNNFAVNLKRVDCDVYLDHNYLGKYSLDTSLHIAKKSEFFLPSKMQIDMRLLMKNALHTLIANEMLVEVKGTTRIGKAGIFITVPFSYSGRHTFSLF